MNGKLKETIQSRKFWFALIAAAVPVLNKELGLNLDTTAVLGIVGAIIAWILGEAQIDSAKIKNGNVNNTSVVEELTKTEVLKSETVKKLNSTSDILNEAISEISQLEKNYREGNVSLVVTLAAVDAWKKKYPEWNMLVPPGFPGAPS